MIELPTEFSPREAMPQLLDFGMILRPASGAGALRVNRAGSRFVLQVLMPDMKPEKARRFKSLMLRAKREGLRMPFPLLGLVQGGGAAKVDGSGAAGTSLPLKNMTPGFMVKQGVWLSVEDAAGTRCLHDVAEPARVDSAGKVTLSIEPPLRVVLVNDDDVLIAKPTIEGIITSDVNWALPVDRIVPGLSFTLEETD
jgi:hypothetical protein